MTAPSRPAARAEPARIVDAIAPPAACRPAQTATNGSFRGLLLTPAYRRFQPARRKGAGDGTRAVVRRPGAAPSYGPPLLARPTLRALHKQILGDLDERT